MILHFNNVLFNIWVLVTSGGGGWTWWQKSCHAKRARGFPIVWYKTTLTNAQLLIKISKRILKFGCFQVAWPTIITVTFNRRSLKPNSSILIRTIVSGLNPLKHASYCSSLLNSPWIAECDGLSSALKDLPNKALTESGPTDLVIRFKNFLDNVFDSTLFT